MRTAVKEVAIDVCTSQNNLQIQNNETRRENKDVKKEVGDVCSLADGGDADHAIGPGRCPG
jgi:hypothetical protein